MNDKENQNKYSGFKILTIPLLLLFAGSLLRGQSATSFLINTVAGNGTVGYSGNGGPATSATLHSPGAVAVDGSGNLYVADQNNNVVRKVATNGIITTVAGNGTAGYSGDGGPATSASLSMANVSNMAVDASGNLYIPDYFNMRVRKVTPSGVITTVVGNGTKGFSGDGGPATSASLYAPTAVATDGLGNLFVADSDNYRVRKITPAGIITTVAGNGNQGSAGNGGPATSAALTPVSLAVDASGDLYVLDAASSVAIRGSLRKVTPAGIITTVFQWPSIPDTFGGAPSSVAVDGPSGSLYVTDWAANLVQQITPAGVLTTVAGNGKQGFSGDGGPATSASLYSPVGVAVGATGNVFFSDGGNQRVRELLPGQPTNSCLYSLDHQSQSFGASGGSGSVGLLTSVNGCAWLASSNASWITITSSGSGTGNSIVTYSVAPNTMSASRTGALSIAGLVFSISQTGVQCSETINPSSVAVSAEGESGNIVRVTASAADCTWTVQNNVSWILISSGNVETGNGNVTYTVGPNSAGFRTTTINIAGQGFTVNQASSGPPAITAGGIVNSASSLAPVAPGSLVSVYGSFPIAVFSQANGGQWPTSLSGLSVQFNGFSAPLYYVSPTQINLQIPWEMTGLTQASVTATFGNQTSNPQTVSLASFAPGIFTMNAQGQGAIVDALSGKLISSSNPAIAAATYLAIYCTGLGPVTNQPATGVTASASQLSETQTIPTVTIGGVPAIVSYSGLAPSFIGLYQINVQAPATVASGNAVPVLVTIGGDTSNAVTIAVVGSQPTGLSGNWTFSAQSSLYGFRSDASGVLAQNGNSLSGQLNLSGTPCATSASVSGTVSGSALSMTLNENGQLVKFTGTVSADEISASGTYVAPSGGCTNGDYGTWSGIRQ